MKVDYIRFVQPEAEKSQKRSAAQSFLLLMIAAVAVGSVVWPYLGRWL
jgi:hypothetical protein